ncbi:Mo-dependent nitrogenase C-terminal domain-containing protein [Oculatella sp. LEGE 06141]|uniref:Mo-dependent nitrogenase C-terminal domain-containing protein n=1 Tax=Oculatella sp. LEGE 06141 TaxID=1828648 RepID=UPI001D147DF4|nr:Mo-dependent nitrogenase C-terminal domain-containing protein [Oculatella sp. LEGE 06141]
MLVNSTVADLKEPTMDFADCMAQDPALNCWTWICKADSAAQWISESDQSIRPTPKLRFNLLDSVRQWLDQTEIRNSRFAHLVCKLIPAQCPFERDIKVLGHTLIHIPPLCKLNPCYEQVVALRFRALCFLADECGEDITPYC